MKIGAQMFTLRDYCKTLPELGEALLRVADIGYTTVQISGTCAYTPEELKPLLDRAGLVCDLTHYSYDRIVGETAAVIDEHTRFGCDYIGIGSMPGLFAEGAVAETVTGAFIEKTLAPAEEIARAGKLLMYHNHGHEYTMTLGGKTVMECLAEAFPASTLGFTLDMHWVEKGGYDPVSEIRRLAGRLPCVHLKDVEEGTGNFAPVGHGTQNYPAILAALEDAGTRFAFVEQDRTYGQDPFDCLRLSYEYLRSLGLG